MGQVEPMPSLQVKEHQDYEIMLKEVKGDVVTYYIKNITCSLTEADLLPFAQAIKSQLGDAKCNIYIYSSDSPKIRELMTKYPLQGKEYVQLADEFAFMLAFDDTWMFYPFQDFSYKEFGGKNWKKEPL